MLPTLLALNNGLGWIKFLEPLNPGTISQSKLFRRAEGPCWNVPAWSSNAGHLARRRESISTYLYHSTMGLRQSAQGFIDTRTMSRTICMYDATIGTSPALHILDITPNLRVNMQTLCTSHSKPNPTSSIHYSNLPKTYTRHPTTICLKKHTRTPPRECWPC